MKLFFEFLVCVARNALPDTTDDDFLDDCLKKHNEYRKLHGAPPVTLDDKVSQINVF
jgi:uncharacterized protein YkwD